MVLVNSLPDGGCALSGLQFSPVCGACLFFAGWRLRLIQPTIFARLWCLFILCRMAAAPYPAYDFRLFAVLVYSLPDGGCALSGVQPV
ncbi:hypothetical protein K7R23_07300 [Citrobacter rodentium NBRC 105723 = DSM 16636]|uniref:hypothetical protein n=1 Tax=Citrobacter rodentium TaxID=67825 RepID=UPI001E362DE4|nr:hypothetical protein [Citrobacter rodentium]UHO32463.1 hypothetical protein K7R23_07300 [Citrobacter rodentium NBRC 105723 = DSM 16636]